MTSTLQTAMLCQKLLKADGRSDWLKRKFILAIRESISPKDAATELRLILTGDWRRLKYHYRGEVFELVHIDFSHIVQVFWKLWRKKSSEYFMTYVQYSYYNYTMLSVAGEKENWTKIYIFVGDTLSRLRKHSFNIGRNGDCISPVYKFVEDRKTILDFLRKNATSTNPDSRIILRIFGDYGNYERTLEGDDEFRFHHERR